MLMVADWESEKDIFSRALELDPGQRPGFLDEVCLHDSELRSRVESLLDYHRDGRDFFSVFEREMLAVGMPPVSFAGGDLVAGRFEVRRFLARGGAGEVYEAYDRELDETVALKVLRGGWASDSAIEGFKTEVRLARRIQNPHVCRVHDVGRTERADGSVVLFFSMEILEGETLSAYLSRKGVLDRAEALTLLKQVVNGLEAAHGLGVLHRDLKSGNIMLVGEGHGKLRAVLTDFGLAAPLGSQNSGPLAGTPAYMAPEQVEGQPLTRATDIYALGVILYEMLTARLPFAGGTPIEQAQARLSQPPIAPRTINPAIPARWEKVILRCLARDPGRRFARAPEVLAALQPSRKPIAVALGLAALGAAAGLAMWGTSARVEPILRASVVVVPFEVAGGVEPRQGAAFSSDLTAELSEVPGVRVVAQTTTGTFKRGSGELRRIRQDLKAGSVLSGSIAPDNGQLQINASLMDSGTGSVLWSHRYEAAAGDLPRVEQTIALASVQALQVEMAPASVRAVAKRHSQNPEAYQAYLLGEYCVGLRTTPGLTQAITYFKRAIELDPRYALAQAGLARAYTMIATRGVQPAAEAYRLSEEAADRALAIDPDLPEALLVKGSNSQRVLWDWETAERYLRRCTQLAPGLGVAHQWLAGLLCIRGRHAEAIAEGALARDLDPLSPAVASSYAMLFYRARRYQEARAELEWITKREPAFANAQVLLAEVYDQMGRPGDAAALVERIAAAGPASYVQAELGYHYARANRGEEARRIATDLETRYAQGEALASEVATVYLGLHDLDQACTWLNKALPAREEDLTVLKVDPLFDPLKGGACYNDLLETLRL
jgi:serine/threonine-protein kinase